MTRRDPRSLMEIRRLAFRAKRSEAAREVLHDALLETFPAAYSDAIRRAQNQTKREAARMAQLHFTKSPYRRGLGPPHRQLIERYVIFRPYWLREGRRRGVSLGSKYSWPNILFSIQDDWRSYLHKDDVHTYKATTPIRWKKTGRP